MSRRSPQPDAEGSSPDILSDWRYLIGIVVGVFVGSFLYFSAPELPKGEIGFLGITLITHYAFRFGGPLVGLVAGWLVILTLRRRDTDSGPGERGP